jgi:hypothetical protein
MTLSPLDDYPVHQVAQPIRYPATSDRNFYDRYYFNCHAGTDELMLIFGMGQYPNLGVTDAFALARHGTRTGSCAHLASSAPTGWTPPSARSGSRSSKDCAGSASCSSRTTTTWTST